MRQVSTILRRLGRFVTILALVAASSVILVRYSPGYFSDARDLDYRHHETAAAQVVREELQTGSPLDQIRNTFKSLLRGDLGRSRQFDVPVAELIAPRLSVTASIVGKSVLFGWGLALCAACLRSFVRKTRHLFGIPAALVLCIPASALVTLCLNFDFGGPVLVLTLLVAARDFKFVSRIVDKAYHDPYILHARAQGIPTFSLLRAHVIPSIAPDLMGLAVFSIIAALGALVPVEVLFNVPGIGQLAWNAAMNRDLPVLLSATFLMAALFTAAQMASDLHSDWRPNET